MLAYMVPKAPHALERDGEARAERARLAEAWKRSQADRLDLSWPRPGKRATPGRPSGQQLFNAEIYKALEKESLPEGLESTLVPGWWHGGYAGLSLDLGWQIFLFAGVSLKRRRFNTKLDLSAVYNIGCNV